MERRQDAGPHSLGIMGLNINVLIADWSWLGEVPPHRRLKRLRDAWYADETGLWEFGASTVEGDWEWPLGPGSTHFGIYEFRRTAGSYKAHFRAGHQWESVRDYADPPVRTALDTLLAGLIWDGPDGTADHKEPGIFSDDPGVDHGVLVARSPTSVRELAAVWRGWSPGSRNCGRRSTSTPPPPAPGAASSTSSPTSWRTGAASSPKPPGAAGLSWG